MVHECEAVLEKTREFAQAILESGEYKEFLKKSKNLQQDATAGQLLRKYHEQQYQLRSEGARPERMDILKETQNAINQNKILQDFTKSQEALVDLLRRTNNIIKVRIDMPFAFSGR